MANWTETWRPQFVYQHTPRWHTLISRFETGDEQRRQKHTRSITTFALRFNAAAVATIAAIEEHFDGQKGSYSTFEFPNYNQQIRGTTLALVDSNPDTITDSGSGFVNKGFDTDHEVWIAGSATGSNNTNSPYEVDTVAAGTLTLAAAETLTADSANSDLVVYKSYTVRYADDAFPHVSMTADVSSVVIRLVEVI